MHYNVTLRRVRTTTVAVENKENNTFSVYVSVALVIQHVVRMRHIVRCCCTALQFFFTLSLKDTIFFKVFEHKVRVLIFPSNFA